ncbi:hypothetical protein [Wenjunlia vitaminophila]|uniref:hypothetical protein n=1 Tax=Wenjunlia vitaminophila TaxID=76728 RepID=UPI00035F8128|nr:hypothetical protein [Wenjunlia vitaminophila]
MPRPTVAQLSYGTATVVLSAVAMLLLTDATSALAVSLVSVAALVLGTLVALAASPSRRTEGAGSSPSPVTPSAPPSHSTRPRVTEHSLHR